MGDVKHTPGPWRAFDDRVISRGTYDTVCAVTSDGAGMLGTIEVPGQAFANALLIAAAPDLLCALRTCIQRIERPELSPDASVVLEKAYAALSKATGEAPIEGRG